MISTYNCNWKNTPIDFKILKLFDFAIVCDSVKLNYGLKYLLVRINLVRFSTVSFGVQFLLLNNVSLN